jgi:hypothetical protein
MLWGFGLSSDDRKRGKGTVIQGYRNRGREEERKRKNAA